MSTGRRPFRTFAEGRYTVRVGADQSPVRAAMVWPIADVLEADSELQSALAAPAASAFTGTVLDLVDPGMIVPPRPRRRRERPVSSRAIFYQGANA